MSNEFDSTIVDVEHAVLFCTGVESIISKIEGTEAFTPSTPEEHYAYSVFDTNDVDIKNINGVEGLAADAGQILYKTLYHVGLAVQQYAILPARFAFSKIKTASLKSTYNNTNARALATNSVFPPERIISVIKNPGQERERIKKLEEKANKGLNKTYGFKIEATALYPIISLAEKSKGNAELVENAVKSAGGIDALLRKHAKVGDDITIDKSPFTKIYDVISKEKGETVDKIIKKIDGLEKDLKLAEQVLSKDTFLLTIPSSLKKELNTIKGFSNDVSFLSDHFLNNFLARLGQDTANFKRIIKTTKGDEDKVTAASRLVKTYVSIAEDIMQYNLKLNKAEIYADGVCAEALYKIIIAAAKAEMAKD